MSDIHAHECLGDYNFSFWQSPSEIWCGEMSLSTASPVEMISNIHTCSLKKEIMLLEIKLVANVTICSSFIESED